MSKTVQTAVEELSRAVLEDTTWSIEARSAAIVVCDAVGFNYRDIARNLALVLKRSIEHERWCLKCSKDGCQNCSECESKSVLADPAVLALLKE